MPWTKASELREMSDEQLQLLLKDTTESLFRLRIQAATERLDAPSELKRHRRLIAQIKTILTERERQRLLAQGGPEALALLKKKKKKKHKR